MLKAFMWFHWWIKIQKISLCSYKCLFRYLIRFSQTFRLHFLVSSLKLYLKGLLLWFGWKKGIFLLEIERIQRCVQCIVHYLLNPHTMSCCKSEKDTVQCYHRFIFKYIWNLICIIENVYFNLLFSANVDI